MTRRWVDRFFLGLAGWLFGFIFVIGLIMFVTRWLTGGDDDD